MKNNLRKILAFILLAIMAYNTAGYILVFELAKDINREIMEAFISYADDSQLQVLKIHDPSSVIHKEKNEIIYQGRHYDVKKEVIENGYTCFYCLADQDEDNIYTGLSASVSSSTESPNGQDIRSCKIIKGVGNDLFCQHLFQLLVDNMGPQKIIVTHKTFTSPLFPDIITPPPKALVA